MYHEVFEVTANTGPRATVHVDCLNEWGTPVASEFSASLQIENVGTHAIVASDQCTRCKQSSWNGSCSGVPTTGQCYRALARASSTFQALYIPTAQQCDGAPTPRDDDECERFPWREQCEGYCPIILKTGAGPWRLTSADDGVMFDLDGDGEQERMGWTSPTAPLAFLAIDLDGNGRIEKGRELFGTGTLSGNGARAKHGFEALEERDLNHDGAIDRNDPVWRELLLWTDSNHDAVSQDEEVARISESPIDALEVQFSVTRRQDAHGNVFRYKGTARVGNAAQPFYDVIFDRTP